MLLTGTLFTVGIFLLWGGAEVLVKGSSKLAIGFGIRPLIVGLTIVAMGTSSPELAVSLISALEQAKNIALGNVIGSNIANIGLVVGVAAIIRPLEIQVSTVRREMPFMIGASLLFYLLSLDGMLSFWDGVILFLGFISFIWYIIYVSLKDIQKSNDEKLENALKDNRKSLNKQSIFLDIILIITGFVGLVYGSTLIVDSATTIAKALGISETVIAMTMVALGTSLPELAISAVGALRGHVDLAVGNAVGSNLFNILFVIAIVAMVAPIPVEAGLLSFHYLFMLGFAIVFLPMMISRYCLCRLEGVILLLAYGVFIFLLF